MAVTKPHVFYRQLATMLDAGLPIVRALKTLRDQTRGPIKRVVRGLHARVDAGDGLAESAEHYPELFNSLERNLLHAGQMTGRLEYVLLRMAENREFWLRLRKQIISKLIYPCILLHVAVFVFAIIAFVLKGTGAAISALGALIPVYLIVTAILLLLKYGERIRPLREFFDSLIYHLPVFGPVARKLALARFARAFQTMYEAGVSVITAMPKCAASCGNSVVESRLEVANELLQRGESLTTALTATGAFDAITLSMIATGEESGSVDTMLGKIAEFAELEASTAIERMGTLFPFMIYMLIVLIILLNILRVVAGYVNMLNNSLQ
jgi:type IV pilus assembly protein PilC